MGILINDSQIGGGGPSNTSRNIGDIFYTTRTDNSLNGAVECNGSQYNFSDFDSNLQSLLDNRSIPSIPISEFDSIVSEKGWCDKIGYGTSKMVKIYPIGNDTEPAQMYIELTDQQFESFYTTLSQYNNGDILPYRLYDIDTKELLKGYYIKCTSTGFFQAYDNNNEEFGYFVDSPIFQPDRIDGEFIWYETIPDPDKSHASPTTYFKVPKLSAYIIQKENIPVIGNGITLGITNGDKVAGIIVNGPDALQVNPNSYGTSIGSGAGPSSGILNNSKVTITTDPTKSGMISDLSNDSFNGRVMIQLFNSTTDTAVATCNQVLADVSALNQGDYVIYYDSADITDHSHAYPNANTLTNHQWYRIYKSGWIEQGGIFTNSIDETIILPVTMSSALYNITTEIYNGQIGWQSLNWSVSDITPTQFHVFYDGADNDPQGFSWEVKGFMLDDSLSSTI